MINKKSYFALVNISPVVIAITFLLCIMGSIFSFSLPNALLPPIKKNELEITTLWPGKSAQDIEQSLVAPMEIVLSGLNGNILIESSIESGEALTRLEFKNDTDMDEAYTEALARINQVSDWPSDAPLPKMTNKANGANLTLASIMLYSEGMASDLEFVDAFENYVKPALSKIEGIANINTSSNPPQKRIDVDIDMVKMTDYDITLNDIISPLSALVDNSGGKLELGNRDYELHFKGQMEIDQLLELPVFLQNNHIVRLKDFATVNTRFESDWNYASIQGHRAFYFSLEPTKNVNVLATIDSIKQAIAELNAGTLKPLNMSVTLSRDDSVAVKHAINELYIALLIGVFLSGGVLLFFIRQVKTIALIFVSIPVCIAFVVIAMKVFHYSINIITLAGIALSIGLIYDAAIVVVEAIYQHLRKGEALEQAIPKAVADVKGAIFSSTFSSIAIFLPILKMTSPEAQLFEDLAFTISTALLSSLIVALFLIPVLARFMMTKVVHHVSQEYSKFNHLLCITIQNKSLRAIVLVLGLPVSVWGCWALLPSVDVLPEPKSRSVLTYVMIGDDISSEAIEREISAPIINRLAEQKDSSAAPEYDVTGMFCVAKLCLLYFYPPQEWDFNTFKHWIEKDITQELPSTQVIVVQANLLRFTLPNSRETQIDIKGDNLKNLQVAGSSLLKKLNEKFPSARITEGTPLQNNQARIEFTTDHEQLLLYGTDTKFLNLHLKTMTSGSYLGRFYSDGRSYPFYLKGQKITGLEQLLNTEIIIEGIGPKSLSKLVDARFTLAPSKLLRIDGKTTVSISATPPAGMPMGVFSNELKAEIQQILKEQGAQNLAISFRGSANRLSLFLQEFARIFMFSLLILVFLLWFTLKSWRLTVAVISSMPLAIVGGMVFLNTMNFFTSQNLDMITIIGLIILMGLVINNAILLTNHFQICQQKGASQKEAIFSAIESRKRAIYMSTGTSILGMLPLMLNPSESSEIYRGLATVIIGGMTFSALFSMSFMAAVLSLPCFNQKH
jgi:multidrug efflux pump subunit AcrB